MADVAGTFKIKNMKGPLKSCQRRSLTPVLGIHLLLMNTSKQKKEDLFWNHSYHSETFPVCAWKDDGVDSNAQ